MITPGVQPFDASDAGVRALVRRLAVLEERVRRLEAVEQTYAIKGTVTSYTGPSVTATITDVAGNVRVLPFLGGSALTAGDPVVIVDLPGYAFCMETST